MDRLKSVAYIVLNVYWVSKMSTLRVHRVKGKTVVRRYRIIPYEELAEVLRRDDEAFLEDAEGLIKRGTVWKAARRLSELVGHPVEAGRAFLRFENGDGIPGYYFSLRHEPMSGGRRRSRSQSASSTSRASQATP
jgi:hypothetical protein